jgi:peroxiredoxin (alkyl hydroperoxide reductase subunit C)
MTASLTSLPRDLPIPPDDGAADHLRGARLPDVALRATDGSTVSLARLKGRTVAYAYPRTGEPGQASLVADWDAIPGARGCTPQSCDFRDHFSVLKALGVDHVYGLSTQTTDYQKEAADRLRLPFPLLSDLHRAFAMAANLPTFEAGGHILLRRLSLVIDDGVVTHLIYPVFPPDESARQVIAWLEAEARA